MDKFFLTMSASQVQRHWPTRKTAHGGGMVEITAPSRDEAAAYAMSLYGPTWAFLYTDINNVHEMDREVLEQRIVGDDERCGSCQENHVTSRIHRNDCRHTGM